MPLDGFTLNLLIGELKKEIIGCRIEKIHQPSNDEIVFYLRSRQGAKKLYISASSGTPRLNLTENAPENPAVPPMMCMFLRKHLAGCIITDISQDGLDRTVFFDLKGTNEIGDEVSFRIAYEAMAKHSNFIVINSEGIILEAFKKTDFSISANRAVLPGFKYLLPPKPKKLNIFNVANEEITNAIKSLNNKMLSASILSVLEGASPLISREIASLVSGNDIAVFDMTEYHFNKLEKHLDTLREKLTCGAAPTMLFSESGKPYDITFTDITQYGFKVSSKEYSSYSELIEKFYEDKNRIERTGQQSRELQKTVSNLIQRSRRKLETRRQELNECADKDKCRIYAELILANQYSLKKGSLYYDLQNFYDNYEIVRIKADPALSPSGNAHKYFKEYNKLKNAEKLLGDLIAENEMDIQYLESVSDAVNRASGYTDISEIKQELYEQGYLKRSKQLKGKKPKPLPPVQYVSDDGYLILVGRNNIQNEILSLKTARKDDSWFHTQKYPGSHVVVVGNGDIIPETTCRQAAIIAAYNSAASDSSQVAVDYTEIRELKKPAGGKPGMVIYHTYNTMWVTPDKELCERLRKK